MQACAASAQSTVSDAERQLRLARQGLSSVNQERENAADAIKKKQQMIRDADARLSAASKNVNLLETEQLTLQSRLNDAAQERASLQQSMQASREVLQRTLRASYTHGSESGLRLLLGHGSIGETQRLLAYQRYFQAQRITQMRQLEADAQKVDDLEAVIIAATEQLKKKKIQAESHLELLKKERMEHAHLMHQLSREHEEKTARTAGLKNDVRTLESVLEKLRRDEATRRAARSRPPIQAPAERNKNSQTSDARVQPRQGVGATAREKTARHVGGGSWPVSGQLLQRYGLGLGDGRTSSGLLIQAAAGTSVQAFSDGTVVYADWMTGYGNILILDHGYGLMSLYAHNESLLRVQGQRVKRGEAIARVGSSGGQGRTALYFEIRRNGQPVDPSPLLR